MGVLAVVLGLSACVRMPTEGPVTEVQTSTVTACCGSTMRCLSRSQDRPLTSAMPMVQVNQAHGVK